MPIRKILAPVNGSDWDANVLSAAAAVAQKFDAHIEALFVRPDPSDALPYVGEGVSGGVIEEMIQAANEAANEAVKLAKANLEKALAGPAIPIQSKPGGPGHTSARLVEAQGRIADVVESQGRLSDLVVFGDVSAKGQKAFLGALEATMMNTGRPILIAPDAKTNTIGESIAIGWDGSVEATHAVTGALPFLRRSKQVEVLCVKSGPVDTTMADALSDYLAIHGVDCVEHIIEQGDANTGAALLDAAQRADADLLVMGGYGHNRLREMIIGGTTRYAVANTKLPLLIAH
jgi:nucleotide-binding universal stress UspA family protein